MAVVDMYDLTPAQWCAMKQGIEWKETNVPMIVGNTVVAVAFIIAVVILIPYFLEHRRLTEKQKLERYKDTMRAMER